MNDPYHILGLPSSATKEEVKSAFRKHALRHHPDHHVNSPEAVRKNAENQFRIIKAAYELISEGGKCDLILSQFVHISINLITYVSKKHIMN